jgi:hypothetical protein
VDNGSSNLEPYVSVVESHCLNHVFSHGGYSFRLPLSPPSRFTAARHTNSNRLLLSVQSPTPDNNTAAKPYATAIVEIEPADRRRSLRTESNAKEWNVTATADDNDKAMIATVSSTKAPVTANSPILANDGMPCSRNSRNTRLVTAVVSFPPHRNVTTG